MNGVYAGNNELGREGGQALAAPGPTSNSNWLSISKSCDGPRVVVVVVVVVLGRFFLALFLLSLLSLLLLLVLSLFSCCSGVFVWYGCEEKKKNRTWNAWEEKNGFPHPSHPHPPPYHPHLSPVKTDRLSNGKSHFGSHSRKPLATEPRTPYTHTYTHPHIMRTQTTVFVWISNTFLLFLAGFFCFYSESSKIFGPVNSKQD